MKLPHSVHEIFFFKEFGTTFRNFPSVSVNRRGVGFFLRKAHVEECRKRHCIYRRPDYELRGQFALFLVCWFFASRWMCHPLKIFLSNIIKTSYSRRIPTLLRYQCATHFSPCLVTSVQGKTFPTSFEYNWIGLILQGIVKCVSDAFQFQLCCQCQRCHFS